MISKHHNTFMEGIQILDLKLIANEAIDSMMNGNHCGMMSKLDIEMAYDHVDRCSRF